MWKNTTTKVFAGFCILILLISVSSVLSFGRMLIQQRETYVYDLISSRSRVKAAEIQAESSAGKTLEEILFGSNHLVLTFDGNLVSGSEHFFEASALAKLAPLSGSLVSTCHDTFQKTSLCSFVPMPGLSAWLVDTFPQESFWEVLKSFAGRILPTIILFVSIAFGLAYVLSKLILAPLRKFVKASQQISRGDYDRVELPANRQDELGQLSDAFKKMIFDLKERENHLARTGLKLAHSARLASIGQMGASIAHEIKNPLAAMLGHAKLLKEQVKGKDAQESAEIIWKESDRCSQIIQQMLRFSRAEDEQMKPIRLKDLLESTLLLLKAETKRKSVNIELLGNCDELIRAKAQQTQQVFLNLLLNAVQAMSPGGSIQIQVQALNNFICIDFIDSGPGIPPEIQKQIFEPFFTTKDKSEGTGLGLSIAQSIMEEQGASLELLESIPGRTAFRLRFLSTSDCSAAKA